MDSFYPSKFWWKYQSRQPDKVKSACEVLNQLTEEQIKAIEFYADGRYWEGRDDEAELNS